MDDKNISEKLKAAETACRFDILIKREDCLDSELTFNIKYQTVKYYLGLPIPKWLAKIIGEDKLFTKYSECEVTKDE